MISQTVALAGTLAYDAVVLFIKLKIIAAQRTYSYHSLTFVLYNLSIDSPLCNAADHGIEYLSHAVSHIFNLLVLDAGAFSLFGQLLAS